MVTLNKPAQGNTSWYQPVTDNWTSLEKQVIAFQGRMQWDSATQVSLQRYGGDTVDVNGESVSIGASGITLTTTDNLILSTGADAAAAMGASTLYYVYVSNSSASPFPNDLRASTTAPSSFNGVKNLGTSGNAANWRFVGYVRTNGSTQFVDSTSQRFVINYYNRRRLHLYAIDTTNSWTYTTATWRQANANAANQIEFISNGEDTVEATVFGISESTTNTSRQVGVGVDVTNADSSFIRHGPERNANNNDTELTAVYAGVLSQGYHYIAWLEISTASGTTTWKGDFSAVTNWLQSGMWGYVMG